MVMTGSWAQLPPHPVIFIPTLYVTRKVESPSPLQTFLYQGNVCNTTIYSNMMVITRVNIPSGWNPNIGVTANLKVCTSSDCSKVLCTNYPQRRFNGQHNCSFLYNTTLSSVYISVTAGNAPFIAWTVAMEFVPKSQYVETPNKDALYYEMFEIPAPKSINQVTEADVQVLQQIVPAGTKHSLQTLNRQDFKLAFCPDAGTTPRYNIDVVVTALDSVSAMATYVCEPPVDPSVGCTPEDATDSDPRGIAINVVTLSTGSGSLKDIYVAVVGWGDGEQTNTFTIGAVVTKPGSN